MCISPKAEISIELGVSCNINIISFVQMSDEDKKFDGMLMTILQQEKQISSFFNRVFGFLRRSTDFFLNQKMAEEAITTSCKTNFDIFKAEQAEKQDKESRRKKKEEEKLKEATGEPKVSEQPKVNTPVAEVKVADVEKKLEVKEGDKEGEKEKEEPAPKGNGGRTDKYIWTQTLQELHLYIPIKSNINKKLLNVSIKTSSLLIQVSGEPAIIDGAFHEKINAEDSIWTIEDGAVDDYKGKYLHLSIEKWKNQNSWWPTPIKGDLEINTQKINPEPSKLEDLEGDTKSTVEKMMFDMRQKQMGLPSSDQLQKQDKLKEFMKAHPEMDFSKCKFN